MARKKLSIKQIETKKIEEQINEEIKEEKKRKLVDRKVTSTSFLLMMPSLVIYLFAAFYTPQMINKIAICMLAIFQFIELKNFIEEYYKRRFVDL